MHKQLEIHHGANARVIEGVNAFYDGDLGWLQPGVGVAPAVQRKIVVFFSDGFARL